MIVSVLMLAMLTGCASSGGDAAYKYAPGVPSDIRVCAQAKLKQPPKGPMSRKQTVQYIAYLKKEWDGKDACLDRMIRYYETYLR